MYRPCARLPVAAQAPVSGSNSSDRASTAPLLQQPPVTSTWPSRRRVAVCPYRLLTMVPLEVHEPGGPAVGIAVGIGVAASEGEGDALGAKDSDALSCGDGEADADGLALADGDPPAPAHPLTAKPMTTARLAPVRTCDRVMAALSSAGLRRNYGAG